MTIEPQYPVVTRALWLKQVQSNIELEIAFRAESDRLTALSKTDGLPQRYYINDINPGSDRHYVYRFWADVETAENWIEFCKISPADYLESVSIIDPSEVEDL